MRLFHLFAVLLLAAVALAEPASPRVVQRYKQMLAANPVEGLALDPLITSLRHAARSRR